LRKGILVIPALSLLATALSAAPILITGTPNSSDNSTGTPTGLSPRFGTLISFDNLTPLSLVSSSAYAASGVTSIADTNGAVALSAEPYSGQSQPIYLGPADFSNIDLLVTLTQPTTEIGVGLLAGNSNSFTLTARGLSNNVLATFTVNVPSTGVTAFNGYYAIQDTGFTIKSLEIVGNGGIDDLQFNPTPEPLSLALVGGGMALLGGLSARRRRK
jgi:hypothetical protein